MGTLTPRGPSTPREGPYPSSTPGGASEVASSLPKPTGETAAHPSPALPAPPAPWVPLSPSPVRPGAFPTPVGASRLLNPQDPPPHGMQVPPTSSQPHPSARRCRPCPPPALRRGRCAPAPPPVAPLADMAVPVPVLVLLPALLAGTGRTARGQWRSGEEGARRSRGRGNRAGPVPRPVPSPGMGKLNPVPGTGQLGGCGRPIQACSRHQPSGGTGENRHWTVPDTGWPGGAATRHRLVGDGTGNGHGLVPGEVGGETGRDEAPLTPIALHRAPLVSRSRCQRPGECSPPRRPRGGRSLLPSLSPTGPPVPGGPFRRGTPGPGSRAPLSPRRCPRWSLRTAEGPQEPGRLLLSAAAHNALVISVPHQLRLRLSFTGAHHPCILLGLRCRKELCFVALNVLMPQLKPCQAVEAKPQAVNSHKSMEDKVALCNAVPAPIEHSFLCMSVPLFFKS